MKHTTRNTLMTLLAMAALAVAPRAGAPAEKARSEAPAASARFGKGETAKWSATTWEAASAEAHKKVLKGGKIATVTGEVVDVSCYLQLGKRGEAHVPCGTKCIQNGQPIGLLDAHGKLYLLMAEEHHPRRDGETDLTAAFLPLLARTVTVTGMMTRAGGYQALFVQAFELPGGKKGVPMDPTMDKK